MQAVIELRAAGVEVPDATSNVLNMLTSQERQVALTVANGSPNREAAARLFLSEKTVEFHLSNVYRKLDLKSRGELRELVGKLST